MPYKPPRAKCISPTCYAWLFEYDPATGVPGRVRPGVILRAQHRRSSGTDSTRFLSAGFSPPGPPPSL